MTPKQTVLNMINSSIITKITLSLSSVVAFVSTYFLQLTVTNGEQFLSVAAVLLLDGFFGVIAGTKREGFKTFKALKVVKSIFSWWLILMVVLTIESSFGASWLSETIIAPFMVLQLISALKNASMSGFIKNETLNVILDKIDSHKGIRGK